MSQDTIADMITCLRNASLQKDKTVEIVATHVTRSIAVILLQEGFIHDLRERFEVNRQVLILTLQYRGRQGKPSLTRLQRISKPGVRIYAHSRNIPKLLGGMGIVIVSTSQGILIDREARQRKLGGEILCYIW